MKSLVILGSACLFSSAVFAGAPNDPQASKNVARQSFDRSLTSITLNRVGVQFPFALSPVRHSLEDETVDFLVPRDRPAELEPTGDADAPHQDESTTSSLEPAMYVGGALAITAILIKTDQRTYNALYDWKLSNAPIRDVSPVITNLGDGRASMAIFGGFLAYSYIGNDRTAFQAGKIGLESFLVSGIVTQILKHTFGRERPSAATVNGGRWNGAFFLLNQGSGKQGGYAHFDAFPSGHTATVFAAATTLSEVYHDSPWVSYASYSIASGVAISRVMERTHWLSDCFVGGIIGYFSTKLVLHFNHSDKPVAIVPVVNGDQVGLALNATF
ncbi:MAG TPA: phosphatase PAP2 family protein [Bacteroidota bacterium]